MWSATVAQLRPPLSDCGSRGKHSTSTAPSSSTRRQREEAERIAEEARKRKSDMVSLQAMFHTIVASPGEQPLGVTLIDGYNLLYRVRLGVGPSC